MADNLIAAQDKSRVFNKICLKLRWPRGSIGGIKRRARWHSDGAPAVDAGSQATYPVKLGDLAYDFTNDAGYIASVEPTANTAATFVKMHA